jgi:hypothetical protein
MARIVFFTLLVAALGGVLAVSGGARSTQAGSPAAASFRLADGSVGCAFDGERIACRARGVESAIVLSADGSSEADDVAVDWDGRTPVLGAAESWWHGGFSCRVDEDAVVCDREAGSITVAPAFAGGASSAISP